MTRDCARMVEEIEWGQNQNYSNHGAYSDFFRIPHDVKKR